MNIYIYGKADQVIDRLTREETNDPCRSRRLIKTKILKK